MELKMEIGFDQLVDAIKQLPVSQLEKLKSEISKVIPHKESMEEFRAFLLKAPVFTDEQNSLN